MKSLTHIHFITKINRNFIPIANLETGDIIASSAISIRDTSDVLPQNSLFEQDVEIKLNDSNLTYFVNKNGFILTDRFSRTNAPLFYKHKLNYSPYNPSEESAATSILLTDKNGKSISLDYWIFDCSSNTIYHSLTESDGIFYVTYPQADENGNLINENQKELLKYSIAFKEAEPKDILETGVLNPDSDAFIIEEQDGQPYFWRLTLPRPTVYQLRYTEDGLLKLFIDNIEQSKPWFIEIQNTVVLVNQLTTNSLLRYTVSEFNGQSFFPFPPYKFIADKKSKITDGAIINFNETDLALSNKTPIDIKIYNPEGILVRALTTDVNKQGILIDGKYWETESIESLDLNGGRASIRGFIPKGYYALTSFYHKNNKFKYTGINLNPLFNPDILNQRVVILCKPTNDGCQKSINHVLLSLDNNILDASDTEIKAWAINKTLEDLKTDWLYIPGESVNNNNNFLMVGIISVINPIPYFDVSIIDARRRGGGIIDQLKEQAFQELPGASQNWDIGYWDGPPIPLQSSIVIYLPEWIRRTYTEQEIKAKLNKYAQASNNLIVRYY